MFKKKVKISNSHSVSNKDKKKLKENLLKMNYNDQLIDALLDDKIFENQELTIDKLQGSKTIIFSRNKIPIMFSHDQKTGLIFPTMYALFQLGDLINLKAFLKQGVEQYIFNGADLMWPGVQNIEPNEFKKYEIAVIYQANYIKKGEEVEIQYAPIAVGITLTNGVPESQKGKAIQIEHFLFDELWNMGPKKIPEQIQIKKLEEAQPIPDYLEEEKTDNNHNIVNEENKIDEEEKEKEISKEQVQDQANKEESKQEEEQQIPVQEMDARIDEAFYRSLIENIKDEDLPMEPSEFQRDSLSLYTSDEFKLDLRGSSYKRIGKLLEIMSKQGVITYNDVKRSNHKLITAINRKHKKLTDFQPKYSLKKVKKQVQLKQENPNEAKYPKVQIEELYSLSKNMYNLEKNVKNFEKKNYYTLKECRDLINQYIKENDLEKQVSKGCIKADHIIIQIIDKNSMNQQNEIRKDQIFKNLDKHLNENYMISQLDEEQLVKERSKIYKGTIPKVKIVAERVANKKQTTIKGLELYEIDLDEITQHLQQKCSASVSLQKLDGAQTQKRENYLIKIQGNQLFQLEQILTEKYKIPIKNIDMENKIDKSKKKK